MELINLKDDGISEKLSERDKVYCDIFEKLNAIFTANLESGLLPADLLTVLFNYLGKAILDFGVESEHALEIMETILENHDVPLYIEFKVKPTNLN